VVPASPRWQREDTRKGPPFHSRHRQQHGLSFRPRARGAWAKALEWPPASPRWQIERTLGKDHPSTLDTVNNMGMVFDRQGEHGKALEWFQRALDGKERTLGKDHPSTLDTVNNMGIVFDGQGEHGKALEWYRRALDGRERTLGKDHPSTLDTVNNMGMAFRPARGAWQGT
jgi:tetratricopeptide (TPR) repeat protein